MTEMGNFRKWNLLALKNLISLLNKVAYFIAKAIKLHMLAKEVIKPCVVDMANIILRDGAVRKLKQVALSNDTICRRINDLNIDIHNQLILDFKTPPLKTLLQLDESTDVSNFVMSRKRSWGRVFFC